MDDGTQLSKIPAEVAARVKAGGWSAQEEAEFKALEKVRATRVLELGLHTDQCIDEADLKMLHLIEQHAFWNSQGSPTFEKVPLEDGALERARDCALRLLRRLGVMCPDIEVAVTHRGRVYAQERER